MIEGCSDERENQLGKNYSDEKKSHENDSGGTGRKDGGFKISGR